MLSVFLSRVELKKEEKKRESYAVEVVIHGEIRESLLFLFQALGLLLFFRSELFCCIYSSLRQKASTVSLKKMHT